MIVISFVVYTKFYATHNMSALPQQDTPIAYVREQNKQIHSITVNYENMWKYIIKYNIGAKVKIEAGNVEFVGKFTAEAQNRALFTKKCTQNGCG